MRAVDDIKNRVSKYYFDKDIKMQPEIMYTNYEYTKGKTAIISDFLQNVDVDLFTDTIIKGLALEYHKTREIKVIFLNYDIVYDDDYIYSNFTTITNGNEILMHSLNVNTILKQMKQLIDLYATKSHYLRISILYHT